MQKVPLLLAVNWIFYWTLFVPDTEGLPLDLLYQNFRGEQSLYVHITDNPANFKPGDYAIASGYTRVKDKTRLVLDDSAEDSIEMMSGGRR